MITSECGKQRTCSCPSRDRKCKWPKPCVNYANCRSAVPVFTLRPFPYCLCSDRRQSSRKEFLGCCCQLHSTKGKTKCSVSQKKKKLLFVFPSLSRHLISICNLSQYEFILLSRVLAMRQPEIFSLGRRQEKSSTLFRPCLLLCICGEMSRCSCRR